jgi:hypothetical protein
MCQLSAMIVPRTSSDSTESTANTAAPSDASEDDNHIPATNAEEEGDDTLTTHHHDREAHALWLLSVSSFVCFLVLLRYDRFIVRAPELPKNKVFVWS